MSKIDKDKKIIEVSTSRAMIYIPTDSIELKISATIYSDEEIKIVTKTLNLQECQQAIRDADENYYEPDDKFELTEEGKRLLGLLVE